METASSAAAASSLYHAHVSIDEEIRRGTGKPMTCPNCSARLIEIERSEVLIDACPQCRGVWLDRGELDRILVKERQYSAGADADDDFFREVEGRRAPPRTSDHGDSEHGESGKPSGKRRRRSFLEDLLDFD